MVCPERSSAVMWHDEGRTTSVATAAEGTDAASINPATSASTKSLHCHGGRDLNQGQNHHSEFHKIGIFLPDLSSQSFMHLNI